MDAVSEAIARLADLPAHDLRVEWRRYHRADPPASFSRDMLLRALAYKLQERAYGGLSRTAKRALQAQGEAAEAAVEGGFAPAFLLKPGVRLVREWRGEAHAVLVLDDGFDYRGQRYRSLSQIAAAITGAHWSGPRFFGQARSSEGSRRIPATIRAEGGAAASGANGQD